MTTVSGMKVYIQKPVYKNNVEGIIHRTQSAFGPSFINAHGCPCCISKLVNGAERLHSAHALMIGMSLEILLVKLKSKRRELQGRAHKRWNKGMELSLLGKSFHPLVWSHMSEVISKTTGQVSINHHKKLPMMAFCDLFPAICWSRTQMVNDLEEKLSIYLSSKLSIFILPFNPWELSRKVHNTISSIRVWQQRG